MTTPTPMRPRDWLLRLYPAAWRERYADEFSALLGERPLGPRDLVDIALSAVDARLRPRAWLLLESSARQPVAAGVPASALPHGAGAGPPPPRQDPRRRFSRRTFLRNALLGSVGVAAVGTGAGAVAFAWQNKTSPFGSELAVPRALVPPSGAAPYRHEPGKFFLIANGDGVLALYWKCPHLGCAVPWNAEEGQFHCPCHGSLYDRFGDLVRGPALRPMDLMALRFDAAGNAIVDTGDIRTRSHYTPAQSVISPV